MVASGAGLWSLIKRAPKAKVARKTYEVEGPGIPNAVPIDDRARSIFQYFKKYNYEVKGTGDVITFTGTYAADKGQAAALVFYTFFSTPRALQAVPGSSNPRVLGAGCGWSLL